MMMNPAPVPLGGMPERTFGRTVRYRRTKLGLSQTKLAELVGRSTTTVRSWERDRSTPNDASVLFALAAVLGLDDRTLFDKAGMPMPDRELSPTVEQALASLAPVDVRIPDAIDEQAVVIDTEDVDSALESETLEHVSSIPDAPDRSADADGELETDFEPFPLSGPEPVGAMPEPSPQPAFISPPDPFVYTAPSMSAAEPSYIEDNDQRQLYRIRNLATFVLIVALIVILIWSATSGIDALKQWWTSFFDTLRL
jgi:transcriptional regulator with XRE-family HTH domain